MGDRVLLLILSSVIAPVIGVVVYFFHSWPVKDFSTTILKYILFDIFLSFLIFDLLCFFWAVLGPMKINRLVSFVSSKVLVALIVLAVGTLLTVIYAVWEVYF